MQTKRQEDVDVRMAFSWQRLNKARELRANYICGRVGGWLEKTFRYMRLQIGRGALFTRVKPNRRYELP